MKEDQFGDFPKIWFAEDNITRKRKTIDTNNNKHIMAW